MLATGTAAIAQDDWIYTPMVDTCAQRSMEDGGPQSCIGDAAGACMSGESDGETTVGMMFCMLGERDAWDVLLNDEYQLARDFARNLDAGDRDLFPEYAVRADQLLAAQRAWIAFRDANCTMEYGIWGSGSMRQLAGSDCQMQMTAERALALRDYRNTFQ
jgi:uncharacterized protein YecT (DUF1311 family)